MPPSSIFLMFLRRTFTLRAKTPVFHDLSFKVKGFFFSVKGSISDYSFINFNLRLQILRKRFSKITFVSAESSAFTFSAKNLIFHDLNLKVKGCLKSKNQ